MEDTSRKKERAEAVFQGIVSALNRRDWNFKQDPENFVISFGVRGNDLPVKLLIRVDWEAEKIRVTSPMTFKMKEDKRVIGTMAVAIINYALSVGAFSMNMSDGEIVYDLNTPYIDSTLTEDVYESLIDLTVNTVDNYNDRLFAMNMGLLDVDEFMEQESN